MIRKALFLFLFLICSLVFSGCHTITGATKGATEGAYQDMRQSWQAVKQSWQAVKDWDKNFRKNYW